MFHIYKEYNVLRFSERSIFQKFVSITGVRQGENLSALLFVIYLDHLGDFLNNYYFSVISINSSQFDYEFSGLLNISSFYVWLIQFCKLNGQKAYKVHLTYFNNVVNINKLKENKIKGKTELE